jgi:hypothetical protein
MLIDLSAFFVFDEKLNDFSEHSVKPGRKAVAKLMATATQTTGTLAKKTSELTS